MVMAIHILNKRLIYVIMMNNLEKLNQVFIDAFAIDEKCLKDLVYNGVSNWDSVGQMVLIANLEEAFDIEIESDDIMDINSYEAAVLILMRKYNISF